MGVGSKLNLSVMHFICFFNFNWAFFFLMSASKQDSVSHWAYGAMEKIVKVNHIVGMKPMDLACYIIQMVQNKLGRLWKFHDDVPSNLLFICRIIKGCFTNGTAKNHPLWKFLTSINQCQV